ncbi:MAG TPA: hypothetical protein VK153_02755 [Candidatus Paceibacterota bacterium]|nr:hypothetical protein [Candidatus Paceibacterota bacterium]
MKNFRIFKNGSLEYVYYHGLARAKFGKKPTAVLSHKFNHFGQIITIADRELAFKIAEVLIKEGSDTSSLLGRPFLRSEIDWGEKYKQHLLGPDKDIPFNPQSGIEQCRCKSCFYRDAPWPNNPNRDCQIGEKGDVAKKFFGWPPNVYFPSIINFKDPGHYCPNYLNINAE